jgi:hypothetical protein
MLRTQSQRRRGMMNTGGWAELPDELVEKVLAKVLELLQAGGQAGGLSFSQASATLRLVSAAWKAVHDALVTRLLLRPQTTDEAVGMLVLRFPTVVSLESKGDFLNHALLTDEALRAVSSLASLTLIDLSWCRRVTDEGVRAVSTCTGLKSLNLFACNLVTDAGLRAVSSCTALTFLDLTCSVKVTDEGVRAVSSCTGLKSLNLYACYLVTDEGVRAVVSSCTALESLNLLACGKVTDEALRALRSLPALTTLDLRGCKVTAAGVQALRNTTAAPSLHIEF